MDRSDPITSPDLSNEDPRSSSKSSRAKRSNSEMGSRSDPGRKRVKMRDLDSVFRSEETQIRHSDSQLNQEATTRACVGKKGEGQAPKIGDAQYMHADVYPEATTGGDSLSLLEAAACLGLGNFANHNPNLKSAIHHAKNTGSDTSSVDASKDTKPSAPTKPDKDLELNISSLGMNLKAEDVSNRLDQEQFDSYRCLGHVKSRVSSECGSSTGPLDENEPLRMWKEMKRNGFLSSTHGGLPLQKQHIKSRKSENDLIKKKMEIAKREQVNKFTKIAAPSGLLTGLNPGIINHVRNSKQVHSIIEALVRSERHDGRNPKRQVIQLGEGSTESNINVAGADKVGLSYENESCKAFLGSRHTMGGNPISLNRVSIPSTLEHKDAVPESNATERCILYERSIGSQSISECEDDSLPLKLSSTTMAMENSNCMPIDEFSPNQETITALSVKAATVAFHWLELLQQDLRGRLAALQRSKKRVRTVILSELPCSMSYEFISNQNNDIASDSHMARWISLFGQMEKTLSEEGKLLESWLRQVKEMQLHCERGLQFVTSLEKDSRSRKLEAIERECAVRAAAASIYSTCNLVTSAENVSCC